ncbi:MAG TPA: GTP cyclohydrolase FolE2 [Casimicrobiaceae bacterium]|nr:GTP cyclohydrolase FolE2 [Casimicrobiaceae bacterium]
MNAPEHLPLPDTQSLPDARELPIERVGVKGLRYPVALRTADGSVQNTIAEFGMYVGLAHDVKGTHMSRFVEILEEPRAPLDLAGFRAMHQRMLDRLGATTGRIEMRFPYFMRKSAPVSGVESLLDYDSSLAVETGGDGKARLSMELLAPVTSLCPCSKKIADYGAHNQRAHITVRVEVRGELGFEELARIAEEEASCELFGLLKRADEKFVTERAYDNPKFVEDLVRDIALRLKRDPRIGRFRVASENFESIHNHSAYAEIAGVGAALID